MNHESLVHPTVISNDKAVHRPEILYGPVRPDLLRAESLADLFEATATRAPRQTALIYGTCHVTYQELNEQADRAASHLIEAGVHAGQIVGLWLVRGIELLVMQLAIAKTGAAWLPFDADAPLERIAISLEDASAAGIVSCGEFAPRLANLKHTVWQAEALLASNNAPLRHRADIARPIDPAYVIYTSGSTGKPKGIAIDQRSICHFLRSENTVLGVQANDRVYQGFSVAFDMSFEEIWITYLVGATLWIAPREIACDPEALPRSLAQNKISVLHAVPTLLALFENDIPCLRLINLGGEKCPESLVARWSRPGRQLFNTYGPTEGTVSASLAELKANEPVTIGTPLPNYNLLVISPESKHELQLLPRGATGELCISGPGVATGYLGRPDLTAEKFRANPWACGEQDSRLYRTGDLARINPDGQVQCLGRADDQVKIRGFRVELGEIEAALAEQPGVGMVAVLLCQDDGIDHLVAYVTPQAATQVAASQLRAALVKRLPPYMMPSRFETLAEMPRLACGKIDRKLLKCIPLNTAVETEGSDVAETPAETALFAALAKLFPGHAIRRTSDFFYDLGGHSLLAARLASSLRTLARYARVTVRDIYQHRTVGRIATALAESPVPVESNRISWTTPSAWRRWRCGAAQGAAVPLLVAMGMGQWLAPFITYRFFTDGPDDPIAVAIAASLGVFLLSILFGFVIAFAGKWLIAGRFKPGRYPLWGFTYYRWWLAGQLVETAPAYLFSGSSLYTLWFRLLGAKIGKDVAIGSMSLRASDLLSIGDYASVGHGVNFENARVLRGELLLGHITIGNHAYIGSFSVLEGNTCVEKWGHLAGQSALSDGERVPAMRAWTGSPARDIGAFNPASLQPRIEASRLRLTGEATFFMLGAALVAVLFFMPVFPTFMLINWIASSEHFIWMHGNEVWVQFIGYFLFAMPASAGLIVCTVLLSAAIRWGVLPRLRPGSWPVHSLVYCGKWVQNKIQESGLQVLHGIYASIYAPLWYRLHGVKVGRDAEISSAQGVIPDLLTLGEQTFIADNVLLGDEEIDGGWMTLQRTVVSRRSFVGNGAYIPDGTTLPENVLIGVLSRAPANVVMREGDTWLGTPPINLPAREPVKGFPDSLTFHPSPLRRIGRGLIEAFRIVFPHAMAIAAGYIIVLNVMPIASSGQWMQVAWNLTGAGLLFCIAAFIFIALFKWILIGRYRQCAAPMWTLFVWLSEAATNMYESVAIPNFMRYLRGTPWLPLAFNLLGCKIGRGVYLDSTDITEFDCVTIGDYSELNGFTGPQTHLFEDRVMKIGHVQIGARVNIGPRSIVLYGATVGDDAQLGPLTLIMKGENIPEASAWRGCPATPTV